MTTEHRTNRTNQQKYLSIYLNKILPTQEEQLEQDRRNAMRIVARAAKKDVSVKIALITIVILVLTIAFA